MTYLIYLLAAILALVVVLIFAVLLPLAIGTNVRAGRVYREKLAGGIEKLRLGKMLAALGIDVDAYISQVRSVDIHEHMTRCKACGNVEKCDEKLADGSVTPDAIGFCNNEQSLQSLGDTLK